MQAPRTTHDSWLLVALLTVFVGAASTEAIVAPLGSAALLRLWTAEALNKLTGRAIVDNVGPLAIAAALPVRVSTKLFGVSPLTLRLPLVLVGICVVALLWFILRSRFGALSATVGCFLLLTVAGVAPLAVALPLRAYGLIAAGVALAYLAAAQLHKFSMRAQALAAILCFVAMMARCALEGIGEIHQRHALAVLERSLDRTAAPGEAIVVTDDALAAPVWFYGSPEVREQMTFASASTGAQSKRLLGLAEVSALPFPTQGYVSLLPQASERVVLASPNRLGGPAQVLVVAEHVPWQRLSGFVSPISAPDTRILLETSRAASADVSSKP